MDHGLFDKAGPLGSEEHLLLLASRQNMDGAEAELFARLLSLPIAWDSVQRGARRHGVLGLLYYHVKTTGAAPAMPAPFLEAARQEHHACILNTRKMMTELKRLLPGLEAAGARSVLLKGVHLCQDVYRSAGLRPFEDIDLLIDREAFAAARDALAGRGYRRQAGTLPERYYVGHHFHVPFEHPSARILVELHWSLLDNPWQRRGDDGLLREETVAAPGPDFAPHKVLGPAAQVVYLALHADKHGCMNRFLLERPDLGRIVLSEGSGNRLIWLCDIREVILKHAGLDWDRASRLAFAAGVSERVGATLRVLDRLFGFPGSDAVPGLFGRARRHVVRSSVCGRLLSRHGRTEREKPPFLWRLNRRAQFRPVRLLGVFDLLFPGKREIERMYGGLSPVVTPLYSIAHLFRVLGCAFGNLARLGYYTATSFKERKLEPADLARARRPGDHA